MSKLKKIFSVVLSCAFLLTLCNVESVFASDFTAPEGKQLTSLKQYNIAPGVKEQHITMVDSKGDNQVQGYAATIDLTKKTGIMAGYKDYNTDGKWGLQTVRDQAAAAEKKTGKNIVVATNGDYFDMSTGEPTGVLVMNGKVVKSTSGWGEGYYYFAIKKDGTATIRSMQEPVDLSDVQEAIGGPIKLVTDGKVALEDWVREDQSRIPRNAVGIKENGEVVLFGADGRQAPKSVGMTYEETAQTMVQLGCKEAIYIDGGGSYTYASKSEGTKNLTVKNSPSDGTERKVSSTLFVYSDAKQTGEFDHATITPDNEVYTPGSKVQFKATGVDSAGGEAKIPSGAKFALKDSSMGTITEDGSFTAGDKTGTVEVQLKNGSEVVGSTTIEVQEPDSISFTNEEVALGFSKESDLGLTVRYKNRQINYNDDDFEWSVTDLKDADKKDVTDPDKKLGTFKGNKFTSSDGATLYGTVHCAYKKNKNVKGSLSVVVGLQPTVAMDFEDKTEDGKTIDAKDYWDFNRAAFDAGGGVILGVWDRDGKWLGTTPQTRMLYGHYVNAAPDPNTGAVNSRGGEESAEIVDISSGEPVRKGNHSLKINYDFSKANGTEGACVGFSDAQQQIPGNPSAVGMYVYAPEGTPNLWIRMRVKDGSGTVQTVNFTSNGCDSESAEKLGGIDWTGWKYVEADLSNLKGPFSLIGGETVRVMYLLNGAGNCTMKDGKITKLAKEDIKGSIYIDNVQFIYGANTTDTDNPLINSVTANGIALNNKDEVVKSNDPSFEINVTDVENKYATGIDYDTKNIWIDGKNITQKALDAGKLTEDQSKDTIYLSNWHLANGTHSIKVLIRDKEGNETTKKYMFDVDGTDQGETDQSKIKAKIAVDENSVYLGENANLNVTTDKREWANTVSAEIKLGRGFEYKDIEYGEGFQEAKAPVYDKSANSVEIFAKKKTDANVSGEGTIATVKAGIPNNITKEKKFSFAVTSLSLEYTDDNKESQELSVSQRTQTASVKSRYVVTVDNTLAGEDTKITVTNEAGKTVKGVGIYTADDESLGETDNNGTVTTSKFRNAQKISVYAKDKEGRQSFIVTTQSFNAGANEDATPAYIQLNASKNSETAKNITWMSNPSKADKKAVAMVARKSDYEAKKDKAFQEYKGTCERLNFSGSSLVEENRAVWMNTVEVTGLEAGSDYVYKVGDGEHWSDVRNFSTCNNGEDTKFFLLGDTQVDDKTILNEIMGNLKKDNYAFGVQTGDFVEKADLYNEWVSILNLFDAEPFDRTDMIHVAGNHEFYGDTTGATQKSIFNIENQQHYSVTYGNVYVAVLGYDSSEKGAKADAEWLVSDASKSNAKWKIVVSHQPPYGTNESTEDCNSIRKYIPEACQQAGIDFMFSGHDHALVRTHPTTDGKTDEKNGVVYYVCGSTGGKSYTPSNSKGFNFAVDPTRDYDGIYFTMNATDTKFTVDVYNADGTKLEDYCYSKEKVKDTCQDGQHDYESTKDRLVCKNCGASKKINKDMTFLVTDKSTGVARYLKNGEFLKSSWIADGKDWYYMDKDGYAETGTVTIDGRKYTFNKKGLYVKGSFVQEEVTLKDGSKKTITRYYEAGGSYARRWREVDGNMYYFRQRTNNGVAPDDGEMYVGMNGKDTKIATPGNKDVTTRSFKFGSDGALLRGAFENETDSNNKVVGTRYYWGNDYVTEPTTIEGVRYDFDATTGYMKKKSLTNCTVSVPDQTYTGKALTPKVEVHDGDQTLTENVNYKVTYKNNMNVGTATATVKGVSSRGYNGTVEVTFKITKKATPAKPAKVTAPSKVKISSVKNIKAKKAKITWKKASNASGYKVYRATSSKGKYKCVKTTGSGSRSWTNSKLKKGKTYYYKVRAYRKASGKTVYGSYSSVKKIKIKK
ncbi:MAG: phosphodiester glycosidase family protein [Eubacteriales bacterium]|nr:phosphodiester glycosidase family protein [Eubacteriales bacterium]